LRVCIHRGTHEIGDTCVEIESQGKRIVLDVGLPLDADPADVPLPPVPGFCGPDDSLLGVFISHPHQDHYGLAHKLPAGTPILIGPAARRILEAASLFVPGGITFDKTIDLQDRHPITLGPFKLTPFLVDHSAYDAYALLVEADGQRLFYSGDFRGHGRKAKLFERLIADPPQNIDVLLMEGTTLGRSDAAQQYPTEADLERKLVELIRSTAGMVLVWCSGQNIDRLVTVFRACRRTSRQFIADMYTASVLRAIGNPKLPQPGFEGFRVFLPSSQKLTVIRKRLFGHAASFKAARIYPEKLAAEACRSVMLFRPSLMNDIEQAQCLDGASLVYSLWEGYLQQNAASPCLEWLGRHGIRLTHCHTSGHAPMPDLKRLAKVLAARMLVPIHSVQPEGYRRFSCSVHPTSDGRWWEVGTCQ
jgi:ribonuclease J